MTSDATRTLARVPAAVRYLLLGLVLGELLRRLNPRRRRPRPVDDAAVASNGHGSAEHLVASGPADR